MSFSEENGYVPVSVSSIMNSIMENINAQFGTTYTQETFVGTNFYKYFYALVQRVQENEVKTSEVFLKLQDYIATTNEMISRPVVTARGLVEAFADAGYVASVKPPADADAGKIYICVDVDDTDPDYESELKPAICALIKHSVVAGVVTQGAESESIVLSNGQSFDFKFDLPTRIPTLLKLTITLSENNEYAVGDPEDTKATLLSNIAAKYSLGKNFEPQKYFSILDAPWAGQIVLEYSIDDGSNWETEIYDSAYDDLLTFALEDVTIVEV